MCNESRHINWLENRNNIPTKQHIITKLGLFEAIKVDTTLKYQSLKITLCNYFSRQKIIWLIPISINECENILNKDRLEKKNLLQDGNRNWLKPIADAFKDEHRDISSLVCEVRSCVSFYAVLHYYRRKSSQRNSKRLNGKLAAWKQ